MSLLSTAERFLLLPSVIDYAGYTFHLQFTEHQQYGVGMAYVLSGCHSNKRYKRSAWKEGYWEDKAVQRQISSMYSNYLFYEPLFDLSDASLNQALDSMRERLVQYKLIHEGAYRKTRDTDGLICAPLRLLEEP